MVAGEIETAKDKECGKAAKGKGAEKSGQEAIGGRLSRVRRSWIRPMVRAQTSGSSGAWSGMTELRRSDWWTDTESMMI